MTTLWTHDVYDNARGVSLPVRCELWPVAEGGWELQVYRRRHARSHGSVRHGRGRQSARGRRAGRPQHGRAALGMNLWRVRRSLYRDAALLKRPERRLAWRQAARVLRKV
jgi:hypothetical protein